MGPVIEPVILAGARPLRLGRALDCEVRLPESERTVSRNHAQLRPTAAGWAIIDNDSTHGTFLNGERLPGRQERSLTRGDRLRVGPWTFRVSDGATAVQEATIIDGLGAGERLVTLETRSSPIHRRRLELLIDAAKHIASAQDEHQLGEVVLQMLTEGTGYAMAALVQPSPLMTPASDPKVIAVRQTGRDPATPAPGSDPATASSGGVRISRQLVFAACKGQTVTLTRDLASTANSMHTLAVAGVRNAICVPVMQDGAVARCLYLDSLHSERAPEDDAAAFCAAVGELCALALSNMRRARLEQERVRDAEQMQAALDIQRGILPPATGAFGPVSYAMHVQPGKQVSGDLFDIFDLGEGRVGFFVGDVTGKGVPAAILAATTQSYLAAALRYHACPAKAVTLVNQHLCLRTAGQKFVTLWCGIVDVAKRVMHCVDAGHGYAMLVPPGADAHPIETVGGLPLRVGEDPYERAEIPIPPGSRIVLYSDGVAEQPAHERPGAGKNDKREQFGQDRVVRTLRASTDPASDVESLIAAVQTFAGIKRGEPLADDLTVASIRIG